MFTITKEELGNRLKQIRLFLSITQMELKDTIDCSQVAISRMESGQGVAWEMFIKVLCYYSNYIYIDSLFQEKFQIIAINGEVEKEVFKSNVNAMAKQMIQNEISHYQEALSDLTKQAYDNLNNGIQELDQELTTKLEKPFNLISPD